MTYCVCALYNFTTIENPKKLRDQLYKLCVRENILGTLLVANEGLNGTVAGTKEAMDTLVEFVYSLPDFEGAEIKFSWANSKPFEKLKVKVRKEIVVMGVEGINPRVEVGQYVQPTDWNDLITRDDVILIDTRNDYEFQIGRFKNSINPDIDTFREFPEWFRSHKKEWEGKKVAMFCTGGIRCEKTTAFALQEDVPEVYHLKGGILAYLEHMPKEESTWEGDCFVFDSRVAVGHGLEISDHAVCHACRRTLGPEHLKMEGYEYGVSCPMCVEETTEVQKAKYRRKQERVEADLGATTT